MSLGESNERFPQEWLKRVPATVFASLLPGEIRITLFPSVGLADGGVARDVPTNLIPHELRMPNTKLWLELNQQMEIVQVTKRQE